MYNKFVVKICVVKNNKADVKEIKKLSDHKQLHPPYSFSKRGWVLSSANIFQRFQGLKSLELPQSLIFKVICFFGF